MKTQVRDFYDWIDENGAPEISKRLRVDRATVRCWRRAESYPTVKLMRKIKKLSRGVIGYEQIIDGKRTSVVIRD